MPHRGETISGRSPAPGVTQRAEGKVAIGVATRCLHRRLEDGPELGLLQLPDQPASCSGSQRETQLVTEQSPRSHGMASSYMEKIPTLLT